MPVHHGKKFASRKTVPHTLVPPDPETSGIRIYVQGTDRALLANYARSLYTNLFPGKSFNNMALGRQSVYIGLSRLVRLRLAVEELGIPAGISIGYIPEKDTMSALTPFS